MTLKIIFCAILLGSFLFTPCAAFASPEKINGCYPAIISVTLQKTITTIRDGQEATREFFAQFTIKARDSLRNLRYVNEQNQERLRQYQILTAEKQRQLKEESAKWADKIRTASLEAKLRAEAYRSQAERNRDLIDSQKERFSRF